jgi:hypothetical protein
MGDVEKWAGEELLRVGGAGSEVAAARGLCSHLGAVGGYDKLQQILEALLAAGNKAAYDRSRILADFDAACPKAAQQARHDSFDRCNRRS